MKMRTPRPMEEASFDLTPMIDVVLLLIVFFMFTTHFAKTTFTPMDLPKERGEATPTEKEQAAAEFVVEMNRDGGMRVLGKSATVEEIRSMLSADLSNARLNTGVVVRADRNCPAVHLNRLVSVLVQMGVRDWKLATASDAATGGTP